MTDDPTPAYPRARARVDDLETRFYALLDACDAYADLLDELEAEQTATAQPNPELLRRYGHQRQEVDLLREQLETGPMETFLRITDRVLMIRETEEGRFL